MTPRVTFRDSSRKYKPKNKNASEWLLRPLRAFRFRLESVVFFVVTFDTYSFQIRYVESPFPSFGRLDRLHVMNLNSETSATFASPRVILHVSSRQHSPRLRSIEAHILRITPRIIRFICPGFYLSFSGLTCCHHVGETCVAILRRICARLAALVTQFEYHIHPSK